MQTQDNAGKKTPDESRIRLYWEQKWMLDGFLRRGAITRAQYDKSLGDLTAKMGMEGQKEPEHKPEHKEI